MAWRPPRMVFNVRDQRRAGENQLRGDAVGPEPAHQLRRQGARDPEQSFERSFRVIASRSRGFEDPAEVKTISSAS